MISLLVPENVAVVVAWGSGPPGKLLPEEAEHVARAVPKRVDEFRAGRVCARRALEKLGAPVTAIGVSENRAPRWPPATVGSITHCAGFRAAAVAWTEDTVAIGIDAEPAHPLPDGTLERIASDRERRWAQATRAVLPGDRLLFSMKESVFKVWSPLTALWLGFEDVEVDVDIHVGKFQASIAPDRAAEAGDVLTELAGRFAVADGVLATAVVVDRA